MPPDWLHPDATRSPGAFGSVTDTETKQRLAQAAYDQPFIAGAPVVLVCCADIKGYLDGMVSSTEDLGRVGAVEDRVVKIIVRAADTMKSIPVEQVGPRVALNVAIAVEHIALRALDFGLGSCWVRLLDEGMIKGIFGWDENFTWCAFCRSVIRMRRRRRERDERLRR